MSVPNPSAAYVPLGMNSPTGQQEAQTSYMQQLMQLDASRVGVPLGMNSPVGDSEWQTFLRRREELLDDGMQKLGLTHQVSTQTGAHPLAAFQTTSLLVDQQPGSYINRTTPRTPETDFEYNRLLGAAQFYQIDGAESMDPQQLAAQVEGRRQYLADRRTGDTTSIAEEMYNDLTTFLAVAGLGSVDGLVNGLKNIPFVGDAIRKSQAAQNYQRGLATLEEGFTGDMLDNERAVYEKYARPLSHFLGVSALVGTTAEAVGATGFAGGVSNPLVRGALQGGATGWLMEGGGDSPTSERALKIAGFAGFGAAVEWGLPKLMARLSRSFPRSSDPLYNEPRPWGQEPPTVDADWQFVDDAAIAGPPRQIGPAGSSVGGPLVPVRGIPTGTPLSGEIIPPGQLAGGPKLLPAESSFLGEGSWQIVPEQGILPRTSLGPGQYEMPPSAPRGLPPSSMAEGTFQAGPGITQFSRPDPVRLTAPEALADAVNASKQATIMESPAVPAFASQPIIEDADVAIASIASNPGQISIVKNVGDVSKIVRKFLQETMPNGIGPNDFRAVSMPDGRVDLLVADGRAVTNRMVKQYQQYGMFDGQKATTATGQEVIVQKLGPEFSSVSVAGTETVVPTAHLMPGRASFIADTAPEAYVEMQGYALSRMAQESTDSGLVPRVGEIRQQLYHGTDRVFDKFELGPIKHDFISPGTIYLTDNPEFASLFAHGELPNVRMAYLKGKILDLTPYGSATQLPPLPPGYVAYKFRSPVVDQSVMPAWEIGVPNPDDIVDGIVPLTGFTRFDWFSDEMASQLPRYIEEFLDLRGITGQAIRGTYTSTFTQARVSDFRSLAPEDFAHASSIQEAANQEFVRQIGSGARMMSLAEIAEGKGLSWAPTPHGMGGSFKDLISGEEVVLQTQEAAYQYLQHFDRTLPDYSFMTTAPVELAGGPAGSVNPGSSLAPDHFLSDMQVAENGHRALDRVEAYMGGGGGQLPPTPPTGGSFDPFDGPASLPRFNETLGTQFAAMRAANPGGYDEMMNRFDGIALKVFEPMRNWSLDVENILHNAGIDRGVMWQHYSDVVSARAVAHNEAVPWHRELNESLSMIRRRFIRDGTVTLIGEMPRDQALHAMENAGYNAREVEGQFRLRDTLEQLRQEYGVGQIMDYMPHLRARAMRGEDLGDLNRMFGGTGRFFAEQVRSGALDVREMNASVLLHRWVRAASFHRYVSAPADAMREAWVGDPRVPLSLRQITSDWLDLVAHGHTPGQDILIPGVRHTLNAIGIPVSNAEVARGVNFIMTNLYRGALGGRPDVIMRDMIGPLFGATRTGFAPLARSYGQFFRGGVGRQEMIDLALRGGWMERGMVPMGASEMFQTQQGLIPGVPTIENTFSPTQNMAREGAARVADFARDIMPEGLRSGIQGTKADPLYWYTKEGEFNRLVSGHSGYMMMQDAIASFDEARVAAPEADLSQLLGRLMRQSGAENYPHPIQRRIAQLVTSRQYEDAAFTYANEVANSQFRYGTAEQSLAVRSSGSVGRFGSTFGTFTTQYIAQMKEGIMNSGLAREFGGTSVDRVRSGAAFLARQGAIAGALGLAGGYTGWNLGKWYWHGSLGFGGGPMLMAFISKVEEATGKFNIAQGEPLSPMQKAAVQQSHLPGAYGGFSPSNINPYAGTFRTLQNLTQTIESASPYESTAQFLVTGKRGSGDATRFFNDAPFELAPPPAWMNPNQNLQGGGTPEQVQQVIRAGQGAVQ